jgi:hypothetical protein
MTGELADLRAATNQKSKIQKSKIKYLTMSKQIDLERITKPLFECLDETFNGNHGIYLDRNTALLPTLDTVSAEEASHAISPGTATIAAQVEHVRFYIDVLYDIITTKEVVDVDWRAIWNNVKSVTPDEWNDSRQKLRDSYQRAIDTLSSLNDWSGQYDVDGALSILAHTAYHLGGIRQALTALRSSKT